MKALNMTFQAAAKKAITNPVSDMRTLCGGIGNKPLSEIQIKKLVAEQKAEQRRRREKKEWEDFIFQNNK